MAGKKAAYQHILDKIKETSTIDHTSFLTESELLNEVDVCPTEIPMLNVALSGALDGGLISGVTVIAGVSKNFKTGLLLFLMRTYLRKHKDSGSLFYCSEFGSPISYFDAFDIPKDRVIISPLTDIEQLKIDLTKQIDSWKRGDKIFVGIDSLGNLASLKEIEDALKGNTTTDMTRAKALKSLFRIITPRLMLKNIPLVAIGHTYKTLEMFSKDQVSGGTGMIYAANNILIIGRKQDKEGTGADAELKGYEFIVNIEKGRFTREKTKISLRVGFDDGISIWSGLMDNAVEMGIVEKKKDAGKIVYVRNGTSYKLDETDNSAFWKPILDDKSFQEFVGKKYRLGTNKLIQEETDAAD